MSAFTSGRNARAARGSYRGRQQRTVSTAHCRFISSAACVDTASLQEDLGAQYTHASTQAKVETEDFGEKTGRRFTTATGPARDSGVNKPYERSPEPPLVKDGKELSRRRRSIERRQRCKFCVGAQRWMARLPPVSCYRVRKSREAIDIGPRAD